MFVGISVKENKKDFYITKKIPELVLKRHASPIMLPGYDSEPYIEELSHMLSGLLLTGGGDVDPSLYGQHKTLSREINLQRDNFEIKLIKRMYSMGKPILAICRGMQVLNVAFGGTLIQHIEGHFQKEEKDVPSHKIFIRENTLLHKIVKRKDIQVNSFHHQAIKEIAPIFIVSAVSEDGIIEAVEHVKHPFIVGVQFHPEYMHEIEPFNSLFNAFIEVLK